MELPFSREKQNNESPFEILRSLKEEVTNLREKIAELEKKFDERIPEYGYDQYSEYQIENQPQPDFS